ncbi:MAG: T9SS type A sorting domain-containing protein, partial [Candidatus Zixiibacteriota bacterium]
GQFILFDAYHVYSRSGGAQLSKWDINIVDLNTDRIWRLFLPQADSVYRENPSFGSTSDKYVVFDEIDARDLTSKVVCTDLFARETNVIENNGISIGIPTYSTDDRQIVFQRMQGNRSTIRRISLDSTKIQSSGSSFLWLIDGIRPYWFVTPTSTDIEEPEGPDQLPQSFTLSQNYPNPFNPATTIEFSLPSRSDVDLVVFNLLGQEVTVLANQQFAPGTHRIEWNGKDARGRDVSSGLYLYRLSTAFGNESRKMLLLR